MSTRDAVIAFKDGAPMVEAETIAQGLGIPVMDVQPLMRSGEITSRCEVGHDKDAGLMRLAVIFFMIRVSARTPSPSRLESVG
jgi:Family of unknown function (DUF6522)